MPEITPIPLICLIISVTAAIIIAAIFIYRLYKKNLVKNLLSTASTEKNLIKKLLYAYFNKNQIIANAVIPALSTADEAYASVRYHIIDAILVTRGGLIAVFRENSVKGVVSNPTVGPWVVTTGGKSTPFPNPLEAHKPAISSLNAVLRKYNITNIPIHDVIVFPDMSESLKFKYHHGNIHTPDTLIQHINDICKERFMSQNDISRTLSCLSACKKRGMLFIKNERGNSRVK